MLKPKLIYHSENHRALKNHGKSTLPESYTWNDSTSVYNMVYRIFKTNCCGLLLIPFKVFLIADNSSAHPRALMGM